MSRSIVLLILFFAVSCSSEEKERSNPRKAYAIAEISNEPFVIPPPSPQPLPKYPWDAGNSKHPVITKDFFRCNGSLMNPPKGDLEDCGGFMTHSLPIKEGQEHIYPILIDLLNYLQDHTGCKAVITAGHRCPEHHFYARIDGQGKYSKHMIGAEVSFYLKGMESKPWEIINLIQGYYKDQPEEYAKFTRYTKEDVDVSTQPWYNKEIYLKLYASDEGRDFDNRHPYPFIRIQVRYDKESKKTVTFNWDQASKGYLRNL